MRVRTVLLGASFALSLLMFLSLRNSQAPPRGDVFWEDDAAAAAAPYVYHYSDSFHSYFPFPGVLVSMVRDPCLPPGTATVLPGGRLGNLILEYASLWTAARLYNLSAFVPGDMRNRLEEVFEPLDMPEETEFLMQVECPVDMFNEIEHNLSQVNRQMLPLSAVVDAAKKHRLPIVFDRYIILVETIVPLARAIRHELRYRRELRSYAQDRLSAMRQEVLTADPSVKEVVFAGVHVRRTDYERHLQLLYNVKKPADETYYGKAALWLHDRVVPPGGELVLVVASDDPEWVHSVLLPHLLSLGFQHSYMAGDGQLTTPGRDLALLSSCNHSVLAYGTFGVWTALSAGGRAVVYHLGDEGAVSPAMQFAQHIPGWVAIN